MLEENKAVLRRFVQEVWSQGNLDVVDELFARDWVGHAPPHEIGGPAALKQLIAGQRLAFPDLQVTVEDQIAEGDKVATRWTARGTHAGEVQGIPPTGQCGTWTGILLARLANGKVIEGWASAGSLGWLRQLDAVPAAEELDS